VFKQMNQQAQQQQQQLQQIQQRAQQRQQRAQQQTRQNGRFVRQGVVAVGNVRADPSYRRTGSLYTNRASQPEPSEVAGQQTAPAAGQGRTKKQKKNMRKTRRKSLRRK
jgi:hypothetical protein